MGILIKIIKVLVSFIGLIGMAFAVVFLIKPDTTAPSQQAGSTIWSDGFGDTLGLRRMEQVQLQNGEIRLSHTYDNGIVIGFENRINSLIWTPDRKLYGGAWPDAHLFQYNPGSQTIQDQGIAVTGMMSLWSLADGIDGRVYGGTGSGTIGYLMSYNPTSQVLVNHGAPISSTSDIPTAETDIMALVSHSDGLIYGGTYPNGHLFTYDPVAGVFDDKGIPVAGETAIRTLVSGPDGKLYGGTSPNGHLFSYNPSNGSFSDKGVAVAGEEQVRALTVGQDSKIYGGTSPNGHLFSYNPSNGVIIDKGIPVPGESIIHDLVVGPDGYIYGGTGVRGHLFAWNPNTDSLIFSEMVVYGESHVSAVAAGGDNKIYAGTTDTAHLVVHDPSTYQNDGFVTTVAISLPTGMQWHSLVYTTSIPANTSLTVDILDSAGNPLWSNVSSGDNLGTINPFIYTRLKLKANLATTDGVQSSALLGWSLAVTPSTWTNSGTFLPVIFH